MKHIITESLLKHIVKNSIERVLKESHSGINSDLLEEARMIANEVTECYNKTHRINVLHRIEWLNNIDVVVLDSNSIIGTSIDLSHFESINLVNVYINPSVVNDDKLYSLIYHELGHLYVFLKNKRRFYADNDIKTPQGYESDDDFRKVNKVLYRFKTDEIKARCFETAAWLKQCNERDITVSLNELYSSRCTDIMMMKNFIKELKACTVDDGSARSSTIKSLYIYGIKSIRKHKNPTYSEMYNAVLSFLQNRLDKFQRRIDKIYADYKLGNGIFGRTQHSYSINESINANDNVLDKIYISWGTESSYDPKKFKSKERVPYGDNEKSHFAMVNKPWWGLWASPVDSKRSWIDFIGSWFKKKKVLDQKYFCFKLKPDAKVYVIKNFEDIARYATLDIYSDVIGKSIDFSQIYEDGYDAIFVGEEALIKYGQNFPFNGANLLYSYDVESLCVLRKECIVPYTEDEIEEFVISQMPMQSLVNNSEEESDRRRYKTTIAKNTDEFRGRNNNVDAKSPTRLFGNQHPAIAAQGNAEDKRTKRARDYNGTYGSLWKSKSK